MKLYILIDSEGIEKNMCVLSNKEKAHDIAEKYEYDVQEFDLDDFNKLPKLYHNISYQAIVYIDKQSYIRCHSTDTHKITNSFTVRRCQGFGNNALFIFSINRCMADADFKSNKTLTTLEVAAKNVVQKVMGKLDSGENIFTPEFDEYLSQEVQPEFEKEWVELRNREDN